MSIWRMLSPYSLFLLNSLWHLMFQPCTIQLLQLSDGKPELLAISCDPKLLDVDEVELQFCDPVEIKGTVTLFGNELVLDLQAMTVARLPCLICNEATPIKLQVEQICHSVTLEELQKQVVDGQYNFSEIVREALLLELPLTAECGGSCPKRAEVSAYLVEGKRADRHQPFSDLELESGN